MHRQRADCALLPSSNDTIDLGHLECCADALRAARRIYDVVDGCPRCAPNCNTHLTEEAIVAALSAAIAAGSIG